MSGETDLKTLLESLHPVARDGDYVYALWPHGRPLEGGIEAAVREAESLTVVLHRDAADSLGLSYDFVATWITLQVHSALEAVGLTAAVSAALTHAGISCNVLAGFHHDHLLVPSADAGRAMEVLRLLARGVVLRSERPEDRADILELTARAFSVSPVTGEPVEGRPLEVGLLEELFECSEYIPELSIVAEMGGEIVGHAMSTRGWIDDLKLVALGPIGVLPPFQRRGVGSALMRETAARATALGEPAIALLGSPLYYPRFGYVPATSMGVEPPEATWGEHFQLLTLPGWPDDVHGTFRYAGPFNRL
ncbi:N-acetyltransferase [Arthrobacter sp. ISL-95]|uniref:N-acetyltransferase n=1 Tax=Arthrobacter sp. ISL-95 TaxID=2819116 RepID=UPI001BE8E164|nr:N-acetyltransferase [Arthrobacter sp. ISL-95]MBT2584594.1 GNAT family N-acetyltransferase [Arthrobacter sp. ISL-95]